MNNAIKNQNDEALKSKDILPKLEEKIYTDAIEISINNTQKHLKDEMINFQKIVTQNIITEESQLKQKLEKKEMED